MENMGIKTFAFFFCFSIFSSFLSPRVLAAKKSYVVYIGNSNASEISALDKDRIADFHHKLLGSYIGSKEKAKEAIFYSYTRHFNGFAATMEEEEAEELSKHPKVLSVIPSRALELHTTRSMEFLGLEKNGEIPTNSLWRKANYGEGTIIAGFDTGVWPESDSFDDEGMGPIPSKWKGHCETIDGVRCNRKLIGARFINKAHQAAFGPKLSSTHNTPRDTNGHGTHTLSTAGGRFVSGVNFLGSHYGTMKGAAPKARVASYKVCWPGGACQEADMLDAFESAVEDGVDVISISIGSPPLHYFADNTAIGAFYAVRLGVPVVMSAGNNQPIAGNLAPWIITVAASSIDREFPSTVFLGNKKQFQGKSLYSNTLPAGKYHPLVNSVDVKAANASYNDAKECFPDSLDTHKVKGKIVFCSSNDPLDIARSKVVADAGGVGMIVGKLFYNDSIDLMLPHLLPTSVVSAADGLSILTYIYSTKSPVAYMSGAPEVGMVSAPIMADFSAPGPNPITPEILKPDITAPGVDILAAYTKAVGLFTQLPIDNRSVPYNIMSGTSMSCPHISGIVALLKAVHPDWSPSAIKSAIMTTARVSNNVRQPIANASLFGATPFHYGAGHVWPNRAADPGLVYDLTTEDYLNFLCSVGYNSKLLALFAPDYHYKCPKNNSPYDFNYPSIAVPHLSGKLILSRTLKNVGTPGLYRVHVEEPEGISVKVTPESLKFSKLHDQKTFKVTLQAKGKGGGGGYVFGAIAWLDGEHYVRSPIAVKKKN